ncbi:MAG TPA: cytochrome P450 [Rhizomicrobium sp.]|nr:cytochrome P450 [Rhizomicrobium sp.]
MGLGALIDFDLTRLPDTFYDDPYPTYRALREHEPVKRLPNGGVFLTRHADLTRVYGDTAAFSSDKKREFGAKYGEGSRLFAHHTTSLVFNDAPYHTRVRKTILGAMIPRALGPLAPKLEALVARLLDRGIEDGIADFAAAIPVEVIGDLLAVPDADRGPLRGWSLAILGALEPVLSDEAFRRGEQALIEFHAYLKDLTAERRRRPGDPERDVLTRLLAADLADHELIENCVFLLNAGHETTTNLIGNALELFARFPKARAGLDLRLGIEEVLRYESSNQLGNRLALRDTEIGGVAIAEGTFVTLCIGAANRDPDAFAAPETFDATRRPNPHLAFAAGPHQCAGMNLARMEATVALDAFLKRFPDYELAAAPVRARRARFRGFARLPLKL